MSTKRFFIFQLLLFSMYIQAQGIEHLFNTEYLMDTKKWQAVSEVTGATIVIDTVTYKTKKALHIPNWGVISLNDLDFKNFIFEADVSGDMSNTMTGLGFRAQDFKNFEYMYLRLMAGNSIDAIQYMPVFNYTIPWILYPQYQATATFNRDWNHIKIEVIDRQVRIFVNNSPTPNFVVSDLKRDIKSGKIMLISEFADAYYANLNIIKLSDDSLSPAPPSKQDIYIKDWQLSSTFNIATPTVGQYRTIADTTKKWETISPDNDGLINLSKYFKNPSGTVLLKKTITSSDDMYGGLIFDYFYQLEIILNDSIIFTGKELDWENGNVMVKDQKYLGLKLNKGVNNLVFIVTGDLPYYITSNRPHFGQYQSQNWGFVARLDTTKSMVTEKWKAVDEKNNNNIPFTTSQYKNRNAFHIIGDEIASLQSETFKNVVIEADITGTGWIGFGFHMKDSCNFDEFYFRLDASNSNSAIQYVPVTNGAVSWALYAGYQAKTIFKDWSHIKITVINNQAKVYVNNSIYPNLIINELRGLETTGKILLEGVYGDSYVANLHITRLSDELTSSKSKPSKKTNITNWQMSSNFEKSFLTIDEYHSMKDTIKYWQLIVPNADGIVNLANYFKIPRGTVIAKTIITASEDTVKKLLFDFTQDLEIILNDSIIYQKSRYTDNVKDDGNRLVIQLKKGQNELVFINTGDYKLWESNKYPHFNNYQSFNWGFKARYDTVNTNTSSIVAESKLSNLLSVVYPNPTLGNFNIKFESNPFIMKTIDVINLSGKTVYSSHNFGNLQSNIDLSEYPKGLYVLKIVQDKNIQYQKICLE